MKYDPQTCNKDDNSTDQIEYSCFYSQCKYYRCFCKFCKSDVNDQHKTHIAKKDDYFQQQQIIKQSIRNAKVEIFEYDNQIPGLVIAISNDLKYLAIGGDCLQIRDHSNNNLIKFVLFKEDNIAHVKFTDDSKILYVQTMNLKFYKFYAKNQFKHVQTYQFHSIKNYGQFYIGNNIYIMSNNILLTCTFDGYIRKINFQQKKQILKIKAHANRITCFDYTKSLNIIVAGSKDKSISLWKANDGQLLIRQQLANRDAYVQEVLFMINNQLISKDTLKLVVIWKIDYQTKRLHKKQTFDSFHYDIQLVLHQQFIISTAKQSVDIYSIDGELIRKFDHNLYSTCIKYNINFFLIALFKIFQPDSMLSCVIIGETEYSIKQVVFKIQYD